MDISDYFVDPSPDGNEWIKRKIMSIKWELRQTIEEIEYLAEQYQTKTKYNKPKEEISQIKIELRENIERANDLASQIRDFT